MRFRTWVPEVGALPEASADVLVAELIAKGIPARKVAETWRPEPKGQKMTKEQHRRAEDLAGVLKAERRRW
jgi:hypothetical protein